MKFRTTSTSSVKPSGLILMVSLLPFAGHLSALMEILKNTWKSEESLGTSDLCRCCSVTHQNVYNCFNILFLRLWRVKPTLADDILCVLQSRTDLVSNGDVGTLPAVFPCAFHAVLTDGPVADGNSLWQSTVFQNDLRRQRLWKTGDKTLSQAAESHSWLCNTVRTDKAMRLTL